MRNVLSLLLALLMLVAPPALAGVTGEQVVSGQATIDRQGAVTTIQASDGAILEFDQLNVFGGEELHFVQPHSQATVLNRVLGGRTQIDGGLFANGIVYIVNPAGVFFGGAAVVDVGGLVAAAGDISNADFLAGVDRFDLSGAVENHGDVQAASVALLGRRVANHGRIATPDGTIALVAGEQVVLTRLGGNLHVQVDGIADDAQGAAIEQTGTLDAGAGSVSFTSGDVYSLALNHTGITRAKSIDARAANGIVQVAGRLDASDRSAGARGGDITVVGERVALLGAELDASGDAGGGTIRVGGDLRGGGALPTARRTFVDAASTLAADALGSGDGGTVIVWADEATAFHGSLSARGGAAGGDGGFAEVSGALLVVTGNADLRAVHGANGTLLYDPQEIQIVGGTANDGSDSPDAQSDQLAADDGTLGTIFFADVGDGSTPFLIYESEIEGTNANVVLEATHGITATGTFDHASGAGEAVGVVRITDGNSLTMRTRNAAGDEVGATVPTAGIDLSGVSFQTSGGGGIDLSAGGSLDPLGAPAGVTVGALTTDGGAVQIATFDGAITTGAITTAGLDGAVDGGAGGDVSLFAGDEDADGTSHVSVVGAIDTSGGDGGTGNGGAGGSVALQTDGAQVDIGGTFDPVQGGGDVAVGAIDSRGGAGTTVDAGTTTNGGAGGGVLLTTTDGAITAGDIVSSGGAGGDRGGRAGTIQMSTVDANMDDANAIVLGLLTATGGAALEGVGGRGGDVSVRSFPSSQVFDPMGNEIQAQAGGGPITATGVRASGGAGTTVGGNAGSVLIAPAGAHDLVLGDALTAAVIARGGDGPDGGGRGNSVTLGTGNGNLVIGAVDTRGGDASTTDALGGDGGDVFVQTGFSAGGAGNATLLGSVDAREGAHGATVTETQLITRDGGSVTLEAGGGNLEHGGQPGPHVRTSADVTLEAGGDVGATGAFVVEGGGEKRVNAFTQFVDHDSLTVTAGGTADVVATSATPGVGGFLRFVDVTATDLAANLSVVQSGAGGNDVVTLVGNGAEVVVTSADMFTSGNGVDLRVQLQNPDAMAPDGTLRIANGAVRAAGSFVANSAGDIVLGDTGGAPAIVAGDSDATPNPPSVRFARDVTLSADTDSDGTGAILDVAGAATGAIDMFGGPANEQPGALVLNARGGIGTTLDPVTVSGGGTLQAANDPRMPNPTPPPAFVPDSAATSGLFVRNTGSGDWSIDQAVVTAGTGAIGLTNEVGDLLLNGLVASRPVDAMLSGPGGDVTLGVGDPLTQSIVVETLGVEVRSGGLQTWDGPVELARNSVWTADGGVRVNGGVDTEAGAILDATLTATLGEGSTFSVRDGVGTARTLRSLVVDAPDTDADPSNDAFVLDTPQVVTSGVQNFAAHVGILQDVALTSATTVAFAGDLDAAAGATGSQVSIFADTTTLAGDVGTNGLLDGLATTARQTTFTAAGDQTVMTGAGGVLLGAGGAVPRVSNVGKLSGNLHLESTSSVAIRDGDKLGVPGTATLVAPVVRLTDFSGLALDVQSPDAQVFARPRSVVQVGGADVLDGGTDLIANTISFTSAPTVVGAGPAPRIATPSGSALNPGTLRVSTLPRAVTPGALVSGSRVFDLVIPTVDPGLETPQLESGPVVAPGGLEPSDAEADFGPPPAPETVVATLACGTFGSESRRPGCGPAPALREGSVLDSPRTAEAARAWRALLGDEAWALAGRRALAAAAAEPGTEWDDPRLSLAARRYLLELARVLAHTRLLGLGDGYPPVREALLAELAEAIDAPGLDAARLGAAVDANAKGLAI